MPRDFILLQMPMSLSAEKAVIMAAVSSSVCGFRVRIKTHRGNGKIGSTHKNNIHYALLLSESGLSASLFDLYLFAPTLLNVLRADKFLNHIGEELTVKMSVLVAYALSAKVLEALLIPVAVSVLSL